MFNDINEAQRRKDDTERQATSRPSSEPSRERLREMLTAAERVGWQSITMFRMHPELGWLQLLAPAGR